MQAKNNVKSSPFTALTNRLWRGTLLLDAVLLLIVSIWYPAYLKALGIGVCLGLFYLWSLTINADNPKKNLQFAFSTLRAMLFAYVLVTLGGKNPMELGIVIAGFLSYKMVLTVEYVLQALPAFQKRSVEKI